MRTGDDREEGAHQPPPPQRPASAHNGQQRAHDEQGYESPPKLSRRACVRQTGWPKAGQKGEPRKGRRRGTRGSRDSEEAGARDAGLSARTVLRRAPQYSMFFEQVQFVPNVGRFFCAWHMRTRGCPPQHPSPNEPGKAGRSRPCLGRCLALCTGCFTNGALYSCRLCRRIPEQRLWRQWRWPDPSHLARGARPDGCGAARSSKYDCPGASPSVPPALSATLPTPFPPAQSEQVGSKGVRISVQHALRSKKGRMSATCQHQPAQQP